MTDGDVPPPPAAPESVPTPEVVPAPEIPPAPVVVPESAIQEISAEITEAVKDAVMGEAPPAEPTPLPVEEVSPKPASTEAPVQEISISSRRIEALATVRAKRRERIERIFELKNLNRAITNNDVEKHLKVSDRTASQYLRELHAEGRLEKLGLTSATRYRFRD